MSTTILSTSISLETIHCPKCAGIYAISEDFKNEAQRLGNFKQCWTCPYCKTERGYGEGEMDRLRKQLAEKERVLTAAKCAEQDRETLQQYLNTTWPTKPQSKQTIRKNEQSRP